MALDPAFLRTVEKHIKSRWKSGCPMCGDNEWEVIGSTFIELSGLAHARNSPRTGEGVEVALVACSSCGWVTHTRLPGFGTRG